MLIEEKLNLQRYYLKSQKSPRSYIKTLKTNSSNQQLQRIYTKSIFNKYNQFMNVLSSKQPLRYARSKQNIKSQYQQVATINRKSQQEGSKRELTKNQMRIRKFDLRKNIKKQEQIKGENLFGSIKLSEEGSRFSGAVNNLQSIYQMPPPPKPIKIEPIGLSTKSTYFGIEPFDRHPQIWLQQIKSRIMGNEDIEEMEKVLKGIQIL